MGFITAISWCDLTWNWAVGCDKVDADCKFCYMYRQSLNGTRYKPNEVRRTKTVFNLPLRYRETKSQCRDGNPLVFACSLTDAMHPSIDGYRDEAWDIIRKTPHLTYLILTKRPERLPLCLPDDWGYGWDNVWLGTSVGTPGGIHRVDSLLNVPAKVHFLSAEPLTEWFDLTPYMDKLDWVILGGESGNDNGKYRYRVCQLAWLRAMVSTCNAANVPVFVKQLGTHLSKELKMSDRHGANINEFPEEIKYREFPA